MRHHDPIATRPSSVRCAPIMRCSSRDNACHVVGRPVIGLGVVERVRQSLVEVMHEVQRAVPLERDPQRQRHHAERAIEQ